MEGRSILKALFRRTLSYSTLKVLWDTAGRILSFFLSVLIARHLGAAEFGRYSVLWYLGWVAAQVTDLGLHLVVVSRLAREKEKLGAAIAAKGALTLVSLSVLTAAMVFGPAEPGERATALLLYVALLACSWTELFGAVLRSQGMLGAEGTALTLLRGGWLFGALVGFARGGTVHDVATALAVASVPALVAAVATVRIRVGSWKSLSGAWRSGEALSFLKQAGPLAVTSIITLVYLRLDVFLLARLSGDESAGLFAAAFRLIEGLFLFSGGIVAGAFPLLAAQVGTKQLGELAQFVLRLLLGVALPASLGLFLLADGIVRLIFGAGYEGSVVPLRVLAWALVPIYMNALTTHLLVAARRGATLVSLMLLRLMVGLAVDLALIPSLGPYGAAVAVVTAEAALSVGSLFATRREFSRKGLAQAGLAPLFSAAAMALAVISIPAFVPLRIVAGALVYGAVFFVIWRIGGERVLPLSPAELLRS